MPIHLWVGPRKHSAMHREPSASNVLIEDQALRDGLQMEARIFTLEEKYRLFEALKAAGLQRIQVGSFVHPQRVPQMADTEALVQSIPEGDRPIVSALVLNEKGLERALACGLAAVAMSVSVSDTHSRKNAGRPAAAARDAMVPLIRTALSAGLEVRAGLQCVFGCVYEGAVAEATVLRAIEQLVQPGVAEISLADTTGMANPLSIRSLVGKVTQAFPHLRIALHLHDTRGLALANMFTGYEAGIRIFDTCAGGLGGCPFVKGAAGNVPTEDAVHMFESMGIATGIDNARVCKVVAALEDKLGRRLPGRMTRVRANQDRRD